MYTYDIDALRAALGDALKGNLGATAWDWLNTEGSQSANDVKRGAVAFVMVPRKTGRAELILAPGVNDRIHKARPGLNLDGWTVDQAARVWLLLHLPAAQREVYLKTIEMLFHAAEMNELVALYGSLPLLAYPETWKDRCAEGIRSNIAQVLQVIMCNNPYPAEYLAEPAWNQLVLKAVFTEKPLLQVYQLRERSNATLAHSLSDYAHERWAAGRIVNPLIWYCTSRFIDDQLLADIHRLGASPHLWETHAAALVCTESDHSGAKKWLASQPGLSRAVNDGQISWTTVARDFAVTPGK